MSDRDAVIARHDGFVAAFGTEDVGRMAEFLTEDHIGMPPGRPQQVGRAAAKEFWREGFAAARSEFTTTSRDLTIVGDTAIDRFSFDMNIAPRDGGAAIHDTGKCVWVWRRDPDGAWRVALAIWNTDMPQPALWSGGG